MAYSVPTSVATGSVITQAWTEVVRDDLLYFKDRADNPPRCILTHNTTQSIANNTNTAVTFNTESSDPLGLHSTGTNPTRVTIPTGETGYYLLTGWLDFAANATGQRGIQLYLNAGLLLQQRLDAAAAGDTYLTIAFVYALAAGDYVELGAFQTSGGALNVQSGPLFSVIRIA